MTQLPMDRALELARGVLGRTSPNPPVGAVLVKNRRIVGEGATQPAGGAHAEIVALREAGDAARGATLYVTLEPCSHWGRTPPCVEAIVAAGVSTVHIAALDPNPLVHGLGVRGLQEHGVAVVVADPSTDIEQLIEAHAKFMRTGVPFVTAFIESEELRSGMEALATTLMHTSDVVLTDMGDHDRGTSQFFHTATGNLVPIAVQLPSGPAGLYDLRSTRMPLSNRVDLPEGSPLQHRDLLIALGSQEVTSVLVAGGQSLTQGFISSGVVDKIVRGSGSDRVHRDHRRDRTS